MTLFIKLRKIHSFNGVGVRGKADKELFPQVMLFPKESCALLTLRGESGQILFSIGLLFFQQHWEHP